MLRRKTQPKWRVLKRLERSLLREFASQDVCRVEFVIEFSEPFAYWVWLGSMTDLQRDALQADSSVDHRIRQHAAEFKMQALYEGYTVESQETVDREFEGSWFYRLR